MPHRFRISSDIVNFVKSTIPSLSPILRSDLQGDLLAEVLLDADRESTLTELAARIGTSVPSVLREIDRLVASGFVLERRSGRNRYVRSNPDHPLAAPVTEIVEYAYGPRIVLAREFGSVSGIDQAYIYGSWAARHSGESGPDPRDIDVLVIGRPDRAGLLDAATAAEARLRREVNTRTVNPERWEADDDPFLHGVRRRPLVRLELPAEEAR